MSNGIEPAALSEEARLEASVSAVLASSPYHEVRNVCCIARGTKVILTGQVSSFYYKQLAQSRLQHQLAPTVLLENRLEVVE
jgi:hypothetical protein